MSNVFVKDVGGPLQLENDPESKAVPGQGVALDLGHRIAKRWREQRLDGQIVRNSAEQHREIPKSQK